MTDKNLVTMPVTRFFLCPGPDGLTFMAGFTILWLDNANCQRLSTPDRQARIPGRDQRADAGGDRERSA